MLDQSVSEIVLATRNPDKGRELGALLGGIGIRIRTLADFPTAPEVEEDGATCEANAMKKAREIAKVTQVPALADDTGLEVDALQGRPGVYAARYAGEHATYEDNCRKLLQELTGVPAAKRKARFLTVAAIAFPSGDVHVTQGTLEGVITEQPIGDRGFGYDPVFLVPEFGKTLAQLTIEEKNRMSHRAKAFVQMRVWLEDHANTDSVA
ncbi:MAG: XTP/dITP diphosphatase [Nitrospira sp.]|nr:XTP/dITP diphosphatase [Nitrospira sp.]